jgi:hypothetical protein
MTFTTVNTGTTANSRDGDSLRTAFTKINNNFEEAFRLLEIGLREWTFITEDYEASNGERIIVDTRLGAVNVTLPSEPKTGHYVQLADGRDFSINPLIIISEKTIEGYIEDVIVDIRGLYIELIFGENTWKILTSLGVQGPPGPPGPGGQSITNVDGGSAVTIYNLNDYAVDGGSASTVFDSTDIVLDGGGA